MATAIVCKHDNNQVVDRAPPLLRDVVAKHIQAWGKREGAYAVAHSPRGEDKATPFQTSL